MYQLRTGKNTAHSMLGNNIQAVKMYRMVVPLNINGTTASAGTKFYFPETPALEQKNIVGIEGHVAPNAGLSLQGDLETAIGGTNVNQFLASFLFMTIFDQDGSEKFYNIPFRSICLFDTTLTTTDKKRVYPYIGKIKTRKSFITFPPNLPATITGNFIATLTFYYNQ
jgi:hypothetical protein